MNEIATDNTTYYYSNGQRIPLVRDPETYAVRFRGGEKSDSARLSAEARALLRSNSEHVGFVPNHDLQIYHLLSAGTSPETGGAAAADRPGPPPRTTPTGGLGGQPPIAASPTGLAYVGRITQLVDRLATEPVVEFAAPVYRRGPAGEMMLVTRQFVAQFKPQMSRPQIDAMNADHGVRIVALLDVVPNGFVLEAPSTDGPTGPVALANEYFESGRTEFAHPDLITRRYWRATTPVAGGSRGAAEAVPEAEPTAPPREARNVYQSQQWHLASANVVDAWSVTQGRPDIKICILDDGVDVGHTEFSNKVVAEYDFYNDTSDAQPKGSQDNHGTACAGVATAGGAKALGAAPRCSLIAACTPAWGASSDEARMFKWAADQGADVISCSWGPPDGTGSVDPLPDLTRAAIHYCVTEGRGGKGCAVLFAAGNGDESVSNDGYAANPDVMAIAACTDADTRASYSDFGPEVSVCAPSNGGSKSILTTDRRGANGYNKTHPGQDDPAKPWMNDPFADLDYTSTFGGTSSSTPLVAGIVGLMLSVNPNLTPAQIRQCLQNTATKIGPAGSYDANGHSPEFGYGKVNAGAAVREAQRLLGTAPAGTPTMTAVQSTVQRSGPPPSFTVDPRPNTHYAIEIAARPELLDADSGQPLGEYYASWEDSTLMSATTYTLPQTAWDRIKHNNRLYYRAWTSASGSGWQNTIATTGSGGGAAALFLQIADSGTPAATGTPTITGPASAARTGGPPSFTIDPRPNTHYAVEFAASPALLDAESGQPAGQYYASWDDGPLLSDSRYTMPQSAWDRLKANSRLYYRAWTTGSSSGWVNTLATAQSGAQAASMEITGAGASGGGGAAAGGVVSFPSGITLNVVEGDQQGGVDYSDPEGSGVPLLSVAGRGEELLSRSFRVRELAGRDASFARIDVALVEALQSLRDQLGVPITVLSAYRHPAQDLVANGLPGNGHVSGQTAHFRVSGRLARDLARVALETLGCQIGIGLGPNSSIEIDVRGSLTTWVLPGSPWTAEQWEAHIGGICPLDRQGRVRTQPVTDLMAGQLPEISAPETANTAGPPPEFRIVPGRNSYFAVEVAVDPSDLDGRRPRQNLPSTRFYGSWVEGMKPVEGRFTTYALPQRVWERIGPAALAGGGRLYYRLVTASAPDLTWPDMEASMQDSDAQEAPGIDVWYRPDRFAFGASIRPEEARWRTGRQA